MAERHPAFAHLPAALHRLLPEIDTLPWPEERHADCAHCPMIDGRFGPWGFRPATRCCTAQPALANFLAGGALRRSPASRALILARLANPEGISAWGIDPPPAIDRRYDETMAEGFGRDEAMRCPFWVGGEHTCGIWHDRSSTCRTWFCKYEDGLAGAVAWSRLHQLMGTVESRLAIWAIERGDPPRSEATPAAWAAWFERAAALVAAATAEDLAPLASTGLERYRDELGGLVKIRLGRRKRLPDVLVPAVSERARIGRDVLITGYSSFDAVRAPVAVFELLARLDGKQSWRGALVEARAAIALRGEPTDWLDEALVRELHRVQALRDPAGSDDLPYTVDLVDAARWSRAAEQQGGKQGG